MSRYKYHVFVCTNERAADNPRGDCCRRGAQDVLDAFKDAVKAGGFRATVRAQKAGCLDQCEYGATVVVYPEGVWYGRVRAQHVPEIVQSHLVEGHPVERLRIDFDRKTIGGQPLDAAH